MYESVSPNRIRTLRKEALARSGYSSDMPYVSRGMQKKFVQSGGYIEGYDQFLPLFQGMNIAEFIDSKMIQSAEPVRILDVGCGRGSFLLDCKERWENKVECVGISAHDITNRSYPEFSLDGEISQATAPALKDRDIKIVIGDAQSLTRALQRDNVNGKFDVVVSASSMLYFSDPFAAIKGMYDVLDADGVAFIDGFPHVSMSYSDREDLENYLRDEYGFVIYYNHMAFQKKRPHLHLPLRYVIEQGSSLSYRLDHAQMNRQSESAQE